MRIVEVPDPDWYLDHVLVVAEPGGGRVGPARQRQGEWVGVVRHLWIDAVGTELEDAVRLARRQGLVLRREQARECGLSDAAVRSLVRRRRWSVPRFGVLCPLPPEPSATSGHPAAQATRPHGLAVQVRASAAALVRPETVVSHESAAAMHGLPLLHPVQRPTLSVVDEGRVAGRCDALVRGVGIRADDTTDWFGAPVMSLPRTVIDLARASGVAAGVAAADAALYDSLTSLGDLVDARGRAHYRPGVRNADRVLEVASPLAESPLESLTRLCLVDGGLPAPELQVWLDTYRGTYRVDMLYRAQQVVVEADGDLKYDLAGGDPLALVKEKRRQEALERAGYVVVRVTWSEVHNEPWEVVARVRHKLAAGGP